MGTEGHTDADDSRRQRRRIIQNALSDLVIQMAAVVIRLYIATWVVRVSMEGVEVGADTFYGSKVLLDCQLMYDLMLKVTVEDEGGSNAYVGTRRKTMVYTCTAAAPISRVLLVKDSGFPAALLVTIMSAIVSKRGRIGWSVGCL
jgi:hypothetical protein